MSRTSGYMGNCFQAIGFGSESRTQAPNAVVSGCFRLSAIRSVKSRDIFTGDIQNADYYN